ncbi:MAG TPA: hydrogenase maturation protease [Bryobacteraceae bacterium]|nr:hydrogenase maturation protease [Bryobacteraceae bacterium]
MARVRLLGLGNELLADDAFGVRVAREVQRRLGPGADVVTSSAAGFHLLDDVIDTDHLVVVDTVQTGSARPGTIRVLNEDQVRPMPDGSPHFLGLFDVLRAARKLGMQVPADVVIIAVEASDCTTVGGPMHPDVGSAINHAVELSQQLIDEAGRARS